jgi:hypothetical protein
MTMRSSTPPLLLALGIACSAPDGGALDSRSSTGSDADCPCLEPDAVDQNFCNYDPALVACPGRGPGGYCDPNGDGDQTDADWERGWRDYQFSCAQPQDRKVACSKLGAQDTGYSAAYDEFLAGCPRVAKFIGGAGGPGEGFAQFDEMRRYKERCGGTTILRIAGRPGGTTSYASGYDLWLDRYLFLESVSDADKAAVDYLESGNEFDEAFPGFYEDLETFRISFERSSHYAQVLKEFSYAAQDHGFRPLVGNLPVGNPIGPFDCDAEGMRAFGIFADAVRLAGSYGGGWAYHSYTRTFGLDAGAESERKDPFRYRELLRCHPDLESHPLFLTEVGFDVRGDPKTDGWRDHGGWDVFATWLGFFQEEIDRDPSVKGALLFTFDDTDYWSSSNLVGEQARLQEVIGPPVCDP